MIMSAHQPAYLPWLGYFDKLKRCDVFVYMDAVQFQKNGFINRNKIKTPNGPIWLTVPVKVKGHMSSTMVDTEISYDTPWPKKHLASISQSYRRAKNFDRLYPRLEELYHQEITHLSELCWVHLRFWMDVLGIHTQLIKLSDLQLDGKKSDLVLEMCEAVQAKHYLSGAFGKEYLKEEDFQAAGISVEYQAYEHPVYPQVGGGDFVPYLGVVDYAMNV